MAKACCVTPRRGQVDCGGQPGVHAGADGRHSGHLRRGCLWAQPAHHGVHRRTDSTFWCPLMQGRLQWRLLILLLRHAAKHAASMQSWGATAAGSRLLLFAIGCLCLQTKTGRLAFFLMSFIGRFSMYTQPLLASAAAPRGFTSALRRSAHSAACWPCFPHCVSWPGEPGGARVADGSCDAVHHSDGVPGRQTGLLWLGRARQRHHAWADGLWWALESQSLRYRHLFHLCCAVAVS